MRLDQTNKEHSLTLDSLYIIHNGVVYPFLLKYIVLNNEQPKKEFNPSSHSILANGQACYYIATHTADKTLSSSSVSVKIIVTGTKGKIGKGNLIDSRK